MSRFFNAYFYVANYSYLFPFFAGKRLRNTRANLKV